MICKDEIFYNEAKKELSKKMELRHVSDNILKALCYVYRKSSKQYFDDTICNFLYFWLGDILLEKLINKHFFSEIILNLFNTLIYKNAKICTAPHYYIHEDDFKNIKLFFDISEDYKIYKSQLYNNMYCNKNYMSYLDTHVQNYKKFHTECEVESYGTHEKRYCKYFKEYFPKEEHNTLSNLKCYSKEDASQSGQLNEPMERVQKEQLSVIPVVESQESLSHPDSASRVSSREQYYKPSEIRLNTSGYELDNILDPSDGSSTSIASKSITGAVSVAGILVPSYLMYNYTYAGTWINKVLGRKTRTNFNPYTDQYLMANFSGLENFNSER
ncbi:variable surface protein Vir7, putative, partial [Plasmodium vivax]